MARSLLQFVGSASTVVWMTLLIGILFAEPANANSSPLARTGSCSNCHACNNTKTGCNYTGTGTGCTTGFSCTCLNNNGNPICQSPA